MNVNSRVMNIETTKLELMHLLLQTQKESILSKIKAVFEQESSTFYTTDVSELRQRADASLGAIEKGQTRSILEVKTDVDNWKSQQSI